MDMQKIIAKYVIEESGLQRLVDALLRLEKKPQARFIINNALTGLYSTQDSNHSLPKILLESHLEKAREMDIIFDILLSDAQQGLYEHEHKPKLAVTLNRHRFMNDISNDNTLENEVVCASTAIQN